MIQLPPPPVVSMSESSTWQKWARNLWEYVRGKVAMTGDAAASIGSGSTYHGVTALTAPRTLTLPDANLLLDGDEIVIQDESGSAGTHTITIARAGTDTVNGTTSVTITSNHGRRRIIKRGDGKYYSA